ncbi:LPXTG cell wall anchor domain-containing protein [Guptibacillus hwajinpoensis]|uniref:LPXTG cell wall anchor domain-containing protein n=1 Tax=Guptibacillus hwajinpoensis TaxID=208199 RepID=UPI003CFEF9F8
MISLILIGSLLFGVRVNSFWDSGNFLMNLVGMGCTGLGVLIGRKKRKSLFLQLLEESILRPKRR